MHAVKQGTADRGHRQPSCVQLLCLQDHLHHRISIHVTCRAGHPLQDKGKRGWTGVRGEGKERREKKEVQVFYLSVFYCHYYHHHHCHHHITAPPHHIHLNLQLQTTISLTTHPPQSPLREAPVSPSPHQTPSAPGSPHYLTAPPPHCHTWRPKGSGAATKTQCSTDLTAG